MCDSDQQFGLLVLLLNVPMLWMNFSIWWKMSTLIPVCYLLSALGARLNNPQLTRSGFEKGLATHYKHISEKRGAFSGTLKTLCVCTQQIEVVRAF